MGAAECVSLRTGGGGASLFYLAGVGCSGARGGQVVAKWAREPDGCGFSRLLELARGGRGGRGVRLAGGRALCQAGRHCVCVRARGGQANERPACNTAAPDKSPALPWLRRQQQQRPQRPLGAKPAQRQREARTELGAETRASEIVRWAELAFCSRAPK